MKSLSDYYPNPDNPRTISAEQLSKLKKSLQTFPRMMELRPIVVDESGMVLGGNQRFVGLQQLGYAEVADNWIVCAADLTPKQKREFTIKDNVAFGEWNWESLSDWDLQELDDWGLALPEAWAEVESEPTDSDAEPQIDRAAELNEKWQVKTGDLWRIGEHRLLCGDSTKRADVERVMGTEKASLVWTDPPYGVDYGATLTEQNPMGYKVRTIENDNLPDAELEVFIRSAFNSANNVTVEGAAIYVACPAGKSLSAFIKAFSGSCFEFRWQLVWVKDALVLSRADYHLRHENILYGWKPGGAHYFTDNRKQDSVFEVARPKRSEEHPTMKPIALIMQMLINSSRPGDIVLDLFGGSGSTMLATANVQRRACLVELAPNYCAVILERMATAFPDLPIERL